MGKNRAYAVRRGKIEERSDVALVQRLRRAAAWIASEELKYIRAD
jgi:hypothetical protein